LKDLKMSETWIRPFVVENGTKRYVEQAEVDADAAREAALAALEVCEPPVLPEADANGLSPARLTLLAFQRWRDGKRAELGELEEARSRALAALGAPQKREAELNALIESDKSGLLAWIKARSGVGAPELRAREREELETLLANDRHAAEISRGALADLDREIETARAALDAIEARERDFVLDALAEEVLPLQRRYEAQLAKLLATTTRLLGAATVVGSARSGVGHYRAPQLQASLPPFQFAAPSGRVTVRFGEPQRKPGEVTISEQQAAEAAAPWRELAERLADDPRAV
jgi:hypothetical protein